MALPDLNSILRGIELRVANLEKMFTSPTSTASEVGPSITNFNGTAVYNVDAVTKVASSTITWTWDRVPDPPSDDLEADPVVDYMFSTTKSTDTTSGLFYSTDNQITVITTNSPLNSTIVGRVYAVTAKGVHGPVAIKNLVVTGDTTPPPQPSTPVLTARLGSVLVTYDGLTSTSTAMPDDFKHVAVHYIYGTNTSFVPDATNFHSWLFSGSVVISANATYDPITVRLVSYDLYGNKSAAPSTGVSATPIEVVSTMEGVVLPGNIGFTDVDNLIVDGSFESEGIRLERATLNSAGPWVYENSPGLAHSGTWYLKHTGNTLWDKHCYLFAQSPEDSQVNELDVRPGEQYYINLMVRAVSATIQLFSIGTRFTYADGTHSYDATFFKTTFSGAYEVFEGVVTVPANAKKAGFYLLTVGFTAGTMYIDDVQIKKVIGTEIIRDAAITNAKIANLAVTDAKIEGLNVGKLRAGEIAADGNIIAGPVAGTHSEMNSSGLEAYVYNPNGAPLKTVRIGTGNNDVFTIVNGDNIVASADQLGRAMYSSLHVPQQLYDANGNLIQGAVFYGREFTEWLNDLPRGVIAWGSSATSVTANTAEKLIVHTQADVYPGRLYKCSVAGEFKTSNAYGDVAFVTRLQLGAKATTTSSVLKFCGGFAYNGNYNYSLPTLEGIFAVASPTYASIALCAYTYNSGESVTISEPTDLRIEDIGPYRNNTTTLSTAATKQNYISVWSCNNSATYQENGAVHTGINYLGQGYTGQPTFGNEHSLLLFTGTAFSGEKTKTIATAMSGATITKVELWLYGVDWYNNTGGTAVVSANTLTALSNTVPNTTKKEFAGFPKPGGKWIDITSLWSNTSRGIWLGRSPSASMEYFGKFGNHTHADEPCVRIFYTR